MQGEPHEHFMEHTIRSVELTSPLCSILKVLSRIRSIGSPLNYLTPTLVQSFGEKVFKERDTFLFPLLDGEKDKCINRDMVYQGTLEENDLPLKWAICPFSRMERDERDK